MPAEADVLEAAQARADALAGQDWEQLDALLHPRFGYVNAQGIRLSRAAYVEFVRDGPLRWREQRLDGEQVEVAGDTAVLTATVVDDVEVDGERHVLRFVTTQTYVRAGGRWLYLAGHTAPPPGATTAS